MAKKKSKGRRGGGGRKRYREGILLVRFNGKLAFNRVCARRRKLFRSSILEKRVASRLTILFT